MPRLTHDELESFSVWWEPDNWDSTYTEKDTFEGECLENGEVFDTVRVGVARRARDLFAVPYHDQHHAGTLFAYFDNEDEANAFGKAMRVRFNNTEAAE